MGAFYRTVAGVVLLPWPLQNETGSGHHLGLVNTKAGTEGENYGNDDGDEEHRTLGIARLDAQRHKRVSIRSATCFCGAINCGMNNK